MTKVPATRFGAQCVRFLVAEWIHFTLFGISTIKPKVKLLGGLMNSATKV